MCADNSSDIIPVQAASASEHQRSLETLKDKKWLTLFVSSRATNAGSCPIFLKAKSRVEFDQDKAESTQGVTIVMF